MQKNKFKVRFKTFSFSHSVIYLKHYFRSWCSDMLSSSLLFITKITSWNCASTVFLQCFTFYSACSCGWFPVPLSPRLFDLPFSSKRTFFMQIKFGSLPPPSFFDLSISGNNQHIATGCNIPFILYATIYSYCHSVCITWGRLLAQLVLCFARILFLKAELNLIWSLPSNTSSACKILFDNCVSSLFFRGCFNPS